MFIYAARSCISVDITCNINTLEVLVFLPHSPLSNKRTIIYVSTNYSDNFGYLLQCLYMSAVRTTVLCGENHSSMQ